MYFTGYWSIFFKHLNKKGHAELHTVVTLLLHICYIKSAVPIVLPFQVRRMSLLQQPHELVFLTQHLVTLTQQQGF